MTRLATLCLASCAVFAAVLPAQTCIYTWGSDPLGSQPAANRFFATASAAYYRTHLLLPAAVFGNVPRLITELSLPVRGGIRQLYFGSVIVRMGQTTITQLDRVFANNLTSPLQDVLVADEYTLTLGPGPVWAPIGMQQPFQYVPGRGDILIEVITYDGAILSELAYQGLAEGLVGTYVRSNASSSLPTIGDPSTFNYIAFRFCVDQGELSLHGLSCGGSTMTPPILGLDGTPAIGGAATVWLSGAPANGAAVLTLGFDNQPPYPLDLGLAGASGCRQFFPIVWQSLLMADGLGIAHHTLSIPPAPGIVGACVYSQYFVVRPGSNALGLLTSEYGRVLIGR